MTTPIRTEHPHIVRVPGVAGGAPVIEGTRIRVAFIAQLLRAGDTADDIIASYEHLKPAAVYDAISYYLDHQAEIEQYLAENTPEKIQERYGYTVDEHGRAHFVNRANR